MSHDQLTSVNNKRSRMECEACLTLTFVSDTDMGNLRPKRGHNKLFDRCAVHEYDENFEDCFTASLNVKSKN